MTKLGLGWGGLLGSLLFFVFVPNSALADCGSVTSINPFSDSTSTEPMADCDNPFAVTRGDVPSGFALQVAGQSVVGSADTIAIIGTSTNLITFTEFSGRFPYRMQVFSETSDGYTEVDMRPQEVDPPTPAEQLALLELFFADDPALPLYRETFLDGDTSRLTSVQVDSLTNFFVTQLLPLFEREVRPSLPLGTYTFVFAEEELCLSQAPAPDTWWQAGLRLITKSAHAQFCAGDIERFAIVVTLEEEAPEPAGASSVLFLPGIQASRLYMDGLIGQNRLWEPNNNGDVRDLALTEDGESINDVYTSDILDEIFGVDNVYREFADTMHTLVATTTDARIASWIPFPYDWRQSVFDVVENGTPYEDGLRYPIDVIEQLAASSLSGQVTIVAHSNGGLLGKAIISELERQGEADLVDRLIMIGTPQLGTPKLLLAALHGYDQEQLGGLLIDDATAREVIINMPGAYGLLPGEAYFDSRNDIVIGFDTSESTELFRSAYGNTVTYSELDDFLLGREGRPVAATVADAAILNEGLLNRANQERVLLDAWQAPAGVEVIEIVGIGVDSISGFEYQAFPRWQCGLIGCERVLDEYKPVPYLTEFGDETVVGSSAVGGESDATYYVDLKSLLAIESERRIHKDLTDASPVRALVTALLAEYDGENISYVSRVVPDYATARSLLSSHSPVYFYVTDTFGNQTGRVSLTEQVVEIPNSQYFVLGDSHYVVLPQGIDYTVTIIGEGEGGMTFRAAELEDDSQQEVLRVSVATTTAQTRITLNNSVGVFSDLLVDVDGNNTVDYRVTPQGEVSVEVVTYETLYTAITEAIVDVRYREWLLELARLTERFNLKPGLYADAIEQRLLTRLLLLTAAVGTQLDANVSAVTATIEVLRSYE